jgi:hypothetical protein
MVPTIQAASRLRLIGDQQTGSRQRQSDCNLNTKRPFASEASIRQCRRIYLALISSIPSRSI